MKPTTVDTENTLAEDHPVIKRGGNETKSQPTLTNRVGKIAINLSLPIQSYNHGGFYRQECYN